MVNVEELWEIQVFSLNKSQLLSCRSAFVEMNNCVKKIEQIRSHFSVKTNENKFCKRNVSNNRLNSENYYSTNKAHEKTLEAAAVVRKQELRIVKAKEKCF